MTTRATIVTDLTYGDAGKGSVVDYLARAEGADLIIRHNGGSQAAHNVVTPDGRHHTFSQFGSGSFVPGVRTHLSRFMLVNPLMLLEEARALDAKGADDPLGRLTIDPRALIITPYHQAANRLREIARGAARHGSCGHGIGETMFDLVEAGAEMVRAGDLGDQEVCEKRLEGLRQLKLAQLADVIPGLPDTLEVQRELETLYDTELSGIVAAFYGRFWDSGLVRGEDELARLLSVSGHAVFEGAQGVLLDEWYGNHPYTTWSTTTSANALALLDEVGFRGPVRRLGLTRAYATRHGAGPFVAEDAAMSARIPDLHNGTNRWQEGFRVGPLDLVALRYALEVNGGIDALAVTCLDRLEGETEVRAVAGYRFDGPSGARHASLGTERRITRLIPRTAPDLPYQEEMTRALERCRPEFTPLPPLTYDTSNAEPLLQLIEGELGAPVALTSWGPTAHDKHERLN